MSGRSMLQMLCPTTAGASQRKIPAHSKATRCLLPTTCSRPFFCFTPRRTGAHAGHAALGRSQRLDRGFFGSARCLDTTTVEVNTRRRGCAQLVAQAGRGREVELKDRLVAALPYLIPLFDGLKYGKFFFLEYPSFARLLAPLDPLIRFYFSFPFASLIVFFAVYAGIVNNFNFSRYVRYNAMQSILLDIILILPGLLEGIFRPPTSGVGLTLYVNAYNTIWVFVFLSVVYAVAACMAGITPRIPLVADSADQQVR